MFFGCHSSKKTTASSKNNDKQFYETYSVKMGFKVDDNCNKKLITSSANWLGTSYKTGGETKSGVDCSGLAKALYSEAYNINVPRTSKELFDQTKSVKRNELKEGDFVFFNYETKKVSHVGIYLKDDKFIHASTKKGVIIGDLNDPYNVKYFMRGGRL